MGETLAVTLLHTPIIGLVALGHHRAGSGQIVRPVHQGLGGWICLAEQQPVLYGIFTQVPRDGSGRGIVAIGAVQGENRGGGQRQRIVFQLYFHLEFGACGRGNKIIGACRQELMINQDGMFNGYVTENNVIHIEAIVISVVRTVFLVTPLKRMRACRHRIAIQHPIAIAANTVDFYLAVQIEITFVEAAF